MYGQKIRKKDIYLQRLGEICEKADGYQEEEFLKDQAEGTIFPLREKNKEIKSYVIERCGHTPWREKYARREFVDILLSELDEK